VVQPYTLGRVRRDSLLLRCESFDILWPSRCLAPISRCFAPISRCLTPISRCLAPISRSLTSCSSMAGEVIPPPYVVTADDKRGLIVVSGAAVLAFVWSCFLIRVWLRVQSREWRSDGNYSMCPTVCKTCTESDHLDWWLAAATLLDTVQSGIMFHLVNLGLGASQDGIPLSQLERLGWVCGFVGSLLPSKHSRRAAASRH
jgi:hypothetical protein